MKRLNLKQVDRLTNDSRENFKSKKKQTNQSKKRNGEFSDSDFKKQIEKEIRNKIERVKPESIVRLSDFE